MPLTRGHAGSTRRTRWLVCASVLLVFAFTAPSASAIMVKLPTGGYANYDALSGAKAPAAARNFDAAFTNLDYSGGPVMPSNTNYEVEWLPSNYGSHTPFQGNGGYSFTYLGGVQKFFQDMAADSGHATNSDAVSTQYNDSTGARSAYSFSYGGLLVDTDALPANGCPALSGHICITDAQIQTELNSFLGAHGLAADLTHEYYLITPPDVASCFDSAGSECSANDDFSQQFCAYHSRTASGYVYSNVPDLTGVNGCDPFVTFCPNFNCNYNNGPADGVLSAISHEHNESTTDPEPNNAWTDWGSSVGGEIGDKCNNDGMSDPNLVPQDDGVGDDTPYNEVIGGDHYLIQREWSNQTKQCLDSFTASATTAAAHFTDTPGSGKTVSFTASTSTSTPGGVAEYVWQFNDGPASQGGQNTTVETTSSTIAHTFPAAGSYTVALTVMNTDGTSNGTATTVTAGGGGGTAPTAAFSDSAPALEGTSISFDASGSSDPNAGGTLSYAWTFGDTGTGTGSKPSHTYSHFGTYTVGLTVTDSKTGLTGSVTHTVAITDESPTAAFTFAPTSPTAGSSVAFDGTGSSDPDGHVASWSWNYGDGSAAGAGSTSSHSYAHAGTYTATLTITDSDGQSANVSHSVTVSPGSTPTYLPPTAAFSGGSGYEPVAMNLSGAGSTDPNPGGALSYAWSFGDGASATGVSVSHLFHAGTWNVTLTVTDSLSGLSGSVSHLVTIADEAPSAAFSPPAGRVGQVLAFSGSGSDPDGSIVADSWSFGDGTTASGASPTHTYASPGTYSVTLTVVDASGQIASVSHAVVIAPRPAVCVAPRLKGMTLSQAKRTLAGAHCATGKVTAPTKKPKHSAGHGKHWALVVVKQSRVPGTTLPAGSRVAITLTYRATRN